MPSSALIFEIIGIDHASHAFEKIEHSAGKAEGKLGKLKVVGGLAFAALAVGAVEMAKKSIEKFQETGVEAIRMQRILGGTAEQVSRLNFAAEEKGIDTDKLTVGFRILSKHLDANDKAWKSLGISAKDAQGKTKPFADLLPAISDRFAKMPAGTEKTALALALFGRAGTNLLPLLNLGSEGLAKFSEESDKLGHTLTGPQLDAIKKNIAAHRQFKAALSGVEIQLGAALYPALAKVLPAVAGFAATLAEKLIPKLQEFGHWLSDKVGPALANAYQRILPGVKSALASVSHQLGAGKGGWQAVGAAVLKFIDVGSKVISVVLPIMIRYWGYMAMQIKIATAVVTTFANVARSVFAAVASVFLNMVGAVINGAAKAFGWIPKIGGPLRKAAADFNAFKDSVNRSLAGIKDQTVSLKVVASINGSTKLSNQAKAKALDRIGFAGGTSNAPAGWAWTGEEGPELVKFRGGEKVKTAGQSAQMAGGGGTVVNITVNGAIDSQGTARAIVKVLRDYKLAGGQGLVGLTV